MLLQLSLAPEYLAQSHQSAWFLFGEAFCTGVRGLSDIERPLYAARLKSFRLSIVGLNGIRLRDDYHGAHLSRAVRFAVVADNDWLADFRPDRI